MYNRRKTYQDSVRLQWIFGINSWLKLLNSHSSTASRRGHISTISLIPCRRLLPERSHLHHFTHTTQKAAAFSITTGLVSFVCWFCNILASSYCNMLASFSSGDSCGSQMALFFSPLLCSSLLLGLKRTSFPSWWWWCWWRC